MFITEVIFLNAILNNLTMSDKTEFDFDLDQLINGVGNDGRALVVLNDNHNSFEWVIETFMEVLQHNYYQAEQCAMIIHNKGKCAVKHGKYEELKELKDKISERGLKVTIE